MFEFIHDFLYDSEVFCWTIILAALIITASIAMYRISKY